MLRAPARLRQRLPRQTSLQRSAVTAILTESNNAHRTHLFEYGRSETSSVSHTLSRNQPAAAAVAFRKLLGQAEGAGKLERNIVQFGKSGYFGQMLQVFQSYLSTGHQPSAELWTRFLQIAGLAKVTTIDISPFFSQGLSRALVDETSLLALMRYLVRIGLIDDAERIFAKYEATLHAEPAAHDISPELWACIIDGHGRAGNRGASLRWFHRWRCSMNRRHNDHMDATASALDSHCDETTESTATEADVWADATLEPDFLVSYDKQLSPAPYLALLKHLSAPGASEDADSIKLIMLMAADGLATTTPVMNALIEHEHLRQERGSQNSIAALYCRMRTQLDTANQPDYRTYRAVFKAFREEPLAHTTRIDETTCLGRLADLRMPPGTTITPREVFQDMILSSMDTWHSSICSRVLSEALSAFISTRDYVGSSVLLRCLPYFGIEPTSRMHAIVTLGILRARKYGQTLNQTSGESFMSDQEAKALRKQLSHLNALAGFHEGSEKTNYPGQQDSTCQRDTSTKVDLQESLSVLTWNARSLPRTPAELRSTRRYEYRNLRPLHRLLQRASGLSAVAFNARVDSMKRPLLAHRLARQQRLIPKAI